MGTHGAGSSLEVSLGTTGPFVEMLAPGGGCESYTANFDKGSRTVPGGGNYETTEVVNVIEGIITYSVDENDISRPLYFGKGLRRFRFRETPAGGSLRAGEAAATIIHTYEERGPRRFAVTLAVDGDTT